MAHLGTQQERQESEFQGTFGEDVVVLGHQEVVEQHKPRDGHAPVTAHNTQ